MKFEKTKALERRLTATGFGELAKLDSFTIDAAHFERFLGHVASQHPAIPEDEQRAEAAYRVLTHGAPRVDAAESASYYPQLVATLNDALGKHAEALDQHGHQMRGLLEDARGHLGTIAASAERIDKSAGEQRAALDAHLAELRAAMGHERDEREREAAAARASTEAAAEKAERRARFRCQIAMAVLVAQIALLVLLLLGALSGSLRAQETGKGAAPALATSAAAVAKAKAAEVPVSAPKADFSVSDAWRARIRDLQYQQDRQLIRLQNLQLEEERAGEQVRREQQEIEAEAARLAAEHHVDTKKFVFDLDTLSWKPKEN